MFIGGEGVRVAQGHLLTRLSLKQWGDYDIQGYSQVQIQVQVENDVNFIKNSKNNNKQSYTLTFL